MVTIQVSPDEARQLKAVLTIIRRKGENPNGTFWRQFVQMANRIVEAL